MVQASTGVGIAQEDRDVEVEKQSTHQATEQGELPAGEEPALEQHVTAPQLEKQAHAVPPAARQGAKLERVSGLLQEGAEGPQPVAATNVPGAIDQGGQLHGNPP